MTDYEKGIRDGLKYAAYHAHNVGPFDDWVKSIVENLTNKQGGPDHEQRHNPQMPLLLDSSSS